MTMTIEVTAVIPPREGKINSTLKLADGSIIGCPPALSSQFQSGGKYEIDFEERNWQGKTYRTVKAIKSSSVSGSLGTSQASFNDHDLTAERIFVCGAYNNALSSGQVNINDLEACWKAVATQREVWSRTFGNKKSVEMKDDIPF